MLGQQFLQFVYLFVMEEHKLIYIVMYGFV